MKSGRLAELFDRYKNESASPAEVTGFLQMWMDDSHAEDRRELLLSLYDESSGKYQMRPEKAEEVFQQIIKTEVLNREGKPVPATVKRLPLYKRLSVAAAILIAVAGLSWLLLIRQHTKINSPVPIPAEAAADIEPGGNKATLTLADGRKIVLDSAGSGLLSEQGKTNVLKTDSGQIAYSTTAAKGEEILFNTIATPKGGQYMVVLSDGTKVWLNAASSLRYPTAFTGTERSVLLTGEAYFEVVHNSKQPFVVHADNIEVHDLGTEFNINAYADEPSMNITLVKGLAAVKNNNESVTLQPGKAATVTGNHTEVVNADISTATAWKNGVFQFNESTIENIMRQVSRWYNVQVEYDGKINQTFNGSIYRNTKLSNVFKILEENGNVRFSINGSKVIVMPVQ